MPRRRRPKPHYIINLVLSMGTLSLFALTGVRVAHTTSAATANPYGSADYCTVENNQTVIYGWAADPDATSLAQPSVLLTVGATTVTAQTNRANYRDAAVASWISSNRSGDPKPGTYGFKVVIPGLVKGNHYPVSGSILNEGPGSNELLPINNSGPTDGDTNKSFFSNNAIPDSCLPDSNLAAQPQPATAATPTNPNPNTATSTDTGATITSGTLAATVQIQTSGAATIRIVYGENPLKLDQSTSDMPTTGATTALTLSGLDPGSTYAYRIVRTDSAGKKTTSPLGNFDTLGFVVALHFVDSRDVGLEGIAARLDPTDKPQTSDDTGTAQFQNVAGGGHTITFDYLGKTYTKSFTADSSTVAPAAATAPQVITLDYSLDMQNVASSAPPVAAKSDRLSMTLAAGAIIVCVGAILVFVFTQSRRRKREYDEWLSAPPPPLPEYKPLSAQTPPVVPGQPGADHMGESLKELVISDFHKNAQTPHSTTHH